MISKSGMDAATRVAGAITDWLSQGGPQWQLIDWLRGYDLPVPDDEQPYLWIARGLDVLGELYSADGSFCARLKAVLDSRLDRGIDPDGLDNRWQERALYNLFMLCACLHCPTTLAAPLLAIYTDLRSQKERPIAMRTWHGLDPCEALRMALVENQIDTTLRDDWFALMEGKNPSLPGDSEAGFEGVLKMHPGTDSLHEPVLDDVLNAFVWMIHHVDDNRGAIIGLIHNAEEVYPNVPWDVALTDRVLADSSLVLGEKRLLMNALIQALDRNELRETRKAGRQTPLDAQDVEVVRRRTDSKRAIHQRAQLCGCNV